MTDKSVQTPIAAKRGCVLVLKSPLSGPAVLPQGADLKIYAEGIGADALQSVGTVVEDPQSADIAVVRLGGKEGTSFAAKESFSENRTLPAEEVDRLTAIAEYAPLVVDVTLDRPLSFPELALAATTVTVNFGASDLEWLTATRNSLGNRHFLSETVFGQSR